MTDVWPGCVQPGPQDYVDVDDSDPEAAIKLYGLDVYGTPEHPSERLKSAAV